MKKYTAFLSLILVLSLLFCSVSAAAEEASFASLTGLEGILDPSEDAPAVTEIRYAADIGSQGRELLIQDPDAIGQVLDALRLIRVTGTAEAPESGSRSCFLFTLSDGTGCSVCFSGRAAEAGDACYELTDDGALWHLLSSLVLIGGDDGEAVPCCVDLYFPSNPSTGFTWEAEAEDPDVVCVIDEYFPGSTELGLTGAGGTHWFHLDGLSEGTTSVAFRYSRPWETGEPVYAFTYRVRVDAANNVFIWGVEMS